MPKKNINLLPPSEQQANRVLSVVAQIRDFGTALTLSLIVLAAFLFAAHWYLREQLANSAAELAAQESLLNNVETANLKKDVETFNKDLANFQKLTGSQEQYSLVLREIAAKLPADLTVDRLNIYADTHKIEIAGRGASRDSVLKLRASLVASDLFTNVNFPLANLERARNASWNFRLYVKPEKLHPVPSK